MYVDFAKWITQRYLTWRGDSIGNERSITEFAHLLGVSQQVMSKWMVGSKPRHAKYINALVKVYGLEVYDVLGLPYPSDDASSLPEPFSSAIAEYRSELASRGITRSSPEAREIITAAFARHGVTITFTDTDP